MCRTFRLCFKPNLALGSPDEQSTYYPKPAGEMGNKYGALLLFHRVAHEEGVGGVTRIFVRAVNLSMRMRPLRR